LQDIEKGLDGELSTEEAINILVKTYDSSQISHQVKNEISQIKKRVSFVTPYRRSKVRKNLKKMGKGKMINNSSNINDHFSIIS
jgi:hypothetical protein